MNIAQEYSSVFAAVLRYMTLELNSNQGRGGQAFINRSPKKISPKQMTLHWEWNELRSLVHAVMHTLDMSLQMARNRLDYAIA